MKWAANLKGEMKRSLLENAKNDHIHNHGSVVILQQNSTELMKLQKIRDYYYNYEHYYYLLQYYYFTSLLRLSLFL